jgi:hypothetical protein
VKQKKKAVTPARDTAFFFQQFLADSNIFFTQPDSSQSSPYLVTIKKKLEKSCMITEKQL